MTWFIKHAYSKGYYVYVPVLEDETDETCSMLRVSKVWERLLVAFNKVGAIARFSSPIVIKWTIGNIQTSKVR